MVLYLSVSFTQNVQSLQKRMRRTSKEAGLKIDIRKTEMIGKERAQQDKITVEN